MGVAAFAVFIPGDETPAPAEITGADWGISAAGLVATQLQTAHLPGSLSSKLGERRMDVATAQSAEWRWAQLPTTLNGRVRLRAPNVQGNAGWSMLDAPPAQRIPFAEGALYTTPEYDVVHRVEAQKLREFILVRERQGVRTWRWQLHANSPGDRIFQDKQGRVQIGGGFRIEPPKLLQVDGSDLPVPVRWQLNGSVLELRIDDRDLPVPYVIDPDATAPVLGFVNWAESSPYAYYNNGVDFDRVWVNTNQAGSITAQMRAIDPETGVNYVSYPALGANWTPAAGNEPTATNGPGIIGDYFDNSQANTYPGTNFTGLAFQRTDSTIDFNWGTGTPYPALGIDTFSIRWAGQIQAPETGTYYFQTYSDDGVRVVVNGTEVVERWDDHAPTMHSQCAGGIALTAGVKYSFLMEFYENGGGAEARVRWRLPSQSGAYRTPTGCDTSNSRTNHSTGWSGGGGTTYPAVPSSAFFTNSDIYERVYSWTAGAANPGTVNATATNFDAPPDTSANVPFEVVADTTDPTGGSISLATTGWHANGNVNINFTNPTDADSGIGSRVIERRLGSADGLGGCGSFGAWAAWVTNPASSPQNHAGLVSSNACYEYRYVVTDNVGNQIILNAAGFQGRDSSNPTITFLDYQEGTNPEYQYQTPATDDMWFNGNFGGSFTVRMTATDAQSGIQDVQFPNFAPGGNWSAGGTDATAPSPFTYVYTWTAGAAEPDLENATARDWKTAPNTTTGAFQIRRDNAGPNQPAAFTNINGWLNATSQVITGPGLPADALSGTARMELERRTTNIVAGACNAGGWTGWTVIDANVSFPKTDTGYVTGTCYDYQLRAYDRVENPSTYRAAAGPTKVDLVNPTGTIDATPYPSNFISNTVTGFTGTLVDPLSGPRRVNVRYSRQLGGSAGTICNALVTAGAWTCGNNWNTTLGADGLYDLILDCEDNAGNVVLACATRVLTVDNTGPTVTQNATPFTLLSGQGFTVGTTFHYNPSAGGSVRVRMDATDAESGISQVAFPNLPAGWSPAGGNDTSGPNPYTWDYTWAVTPTSPGSRTATATNGSGKTGTGNFVIQQDNTAPAAGTRAAPTGWTNDLSPTLTYSGYTDTGGSGIATYQWQRRMTTLTGSTCVVGGWTGWANQGPANPGASWDDVTIDDRCYEYRLVVTDNVGNPYTSASTATMMTDTVAPSGGINVLPAGPFTLTANFAGTSSDPTGKWPTLFTLRYVGATSGNICLNAATGGSGNWTCNWNTVPILDGTYVIHLDVTDAAGNTTISAATRSVVVDHTGPALTLGTIAGVLNPGNSYVVGSNVFVNTSLTGSIIIPVTATDAAGVANVGFPDLDGAGTLWTPGSGSDITAPYDRTYTWAAGAVSPGPQTVTGADGLGNTSTAVGLFTVTADPDEPVGGSMAYADGYQASVTLTFGEGTDAGSGIKTWQIERRETTLTAGSCGAWVAAWGPWGGTNLASTQTDNSVVTGNCYQYRLAVADQVNNVAYWTSPNTAKIDNPGVIVAESGGTTNVTEAGGTDTYTVQLNSPPASNVTVTPTPDAQVGAAPTPLTFTPGNWNTPQTVTVSAVNDFVAEGAHTGTLTHVSTSADLSYDGIVAPSVTANITDNDSVGMTLVQSGGSTDVAEVGGTDTFTVVLGSAPTSPVTVTVAGNSQVSAAPATLTFNAGNWNVAQTVTVSAVNDDVDEAAVHPGSVTTTVTSADSGYNGFVLGPVPVNVTDNDTAGINAVTSGGTLDVIEGGATDTVSLNLTSQPLADVTIALSVDAQITALPATITFTPANWNIAQILTITAVDDSIDEAATHSGLLTATISSADPNPAYNTVDPGPVNVTDNDTAGVVVLESGGTTLLSEAGATDTYTVVLSTQPTADVTVNVGTADGQTTASPNSLTFTSVNWATPQTVTATAVNDLVSEASPHPGVLTHTSTSGDPNYNAAIIASVTSQITDNDIPGVVVSAPTVSVTEGGATATYTLVLATQPTASVTINLTDGADADALPASVTFTTVNWATPQTVTVTAVNDLIDEGAHTDTVTQAATSADPLYNGISVANVGVNVTDNDTAGVVKIESGGTTAIAEAGATSDTFTVALATEPTSPVTIAVAGDADGSVAPATLTFTTLDWATPQTVTVTAIDDPIAEGAHTASTSFTVTSVDTKYNAMVVAPVSAAVTDDDTASVTATQTAGSTDAAEGGATDVINFVLTSQPASPVTVALTPNSQVSVAPASLTFTAANWNVVQPVTVTAVNDFIAEGAHTGSISYAVTSADGQYNGFVLGSTTVNITDNDTAGVTVVETGGTTTATEGGAGDTYTVVLTSQPTGSVTVGIGADAQITAAPATLTFTTGNWATPQTVTVGAVNDAIVEGAHSGSSSLTMGGADPAYAGLTPAPVSVAITDDDSAGVSVVESGGTTTATEGGAGDTYTLVLTSQPTAAVTIAVTADADGTAAPASVTFTTLNWATPQTITVGAFNDAIVEGAHTATFTHAVTSADLNYNALPTGSVVAAITDDDVPGIVLTETGGTAVAEGGASDTFSLVLSSQPTADVVIALDTSDGQTTAPATVTFTSANWNVPQVITVNAVNDDIDEAAIHAGAILTTVTSADLTYDGFAVADVAVAVTDNDTAGYTIVESGGSTDVAETATTSDTFTVVLTSQPTASVSIAVSGDANATAGPALVFTTVNWATPQMVTVTAVDDQLDEAAVHPATISLVPSSLDLTYNGLAIPPRTANVTDDDDSGITVTRSGGSNDVAEAGTTTDTFTVVLDSQPLVDVTVAVAGDVDAGAAPATLTFTTANWATPQTVTVTAVDDAIYEGAHVATTTLDVTAGDVNYLALTIPDESVNVTDDDVASVVITETGGSTDVVEGGATDTYAVVLTSQPTANVTVSLNDDVDVDATPPALTFTAANWNVPQVITVAGTNDSIAEGVHTGTVTHSVASGDAAYNGYVVADVVANVTDDDSSGVTVSPGTAALAEGAVGTTYTVKLDSEPTAPVSIAVNPDAQVTATPATLNFTAATWNSPQTVTVTAVDDLVSEASPHPGVVSHVATSADPVYSGITISDKLADITDNDIPNIVVVESAGSTAATEGGAGDSIDIVLGTMPTGDVTIALNSADGQAQAVPATVTFTAANWNTPQSVAIQAVDDSVDEDAHTGVIEYVVTSPDPIYDGWVLADLSAAITDNDTAAVSVVQSGGTTDVAEPATTDTFTVALVTQPTADVTVAVSDDADVDASPATLTFTAANWNTPQTVTVTAHDDFIAEGLHTGATSFALTSADTKYDAMLVPPVSANVTDDDVAAITVTPTGANDVTEGGATDTFDVVLTSEPTSPVTVTPTGDSQVSASAALTFTPANWNVPQTVTITAVDDDVDEVDPHPGNVTFAVTSVDTSYNAMPVAAQAFAVHDDDTVGVVVLETGTTDVAEGGAGDTYTVVLTSQPTAAVTVALTPDAQVTALPATLTFTSANWATPQTVTVGAVDDLIDEADLHPGVIAHAVTSADTGYNGFVTASVTAAVTDNDNADVTIVESSGTTAVTEGGAGDTYTVVLATQPTADVTVALGPDAQVTAVPATLTFTSVNWNVPQTVTVGAVNDAITEADPHPGTIAHVVTSADLEYDALVVPAVVASVTDDDIPDIVVTESAGSTAVDEAVVATDDISIVLATQPVADVVIGFTNSDGQLILGSPTITFTAANWNVAQVLNVGAFDDDVDEDAHTGLIELAATSADPVYNNWTLADITVAVADDDTAGFTLTESGGSTDVAEAGATSDTVSIVLNSQPTADVVLTLTDDADVDAAPTTVTFTAANWNAPQTVTIQAVDDFIDEGAHTGTTSFAVGSADAKYSGLTLASVAANITDDDTANVIVTESLGSTDVLEAGATSDTATVVLGSEPESPVTIALTSDAQVTSAPATLTFTPANWNVAQTVTITAVDDFTQEAATHPGVTTFAATSADAKYQGFAVPGITAVVTDNDLADVIVTESAASTDVTEGAATDSVDVQLGSMPTAPVTITLTSNAQVGAAPATLTFTPLNWNVVQVVTITAVDDSIDEVSPHAGTVSFAIASADPYYTPITEPDVAVDVTDNDDAGVTITESGTTDVDENGSTDSYDVVLNTEPTADVTIALGPDAQVGATPGPLTFTSANWNVPQTVTVTAVDDLVVEAPTHPGVITHTSTSGDTFYNAIPIAAVTANVTDNDTPDVIVTSTGGSNDVAEGGAGDTFDVVLGSMPTADVTITMSGTQVTTAPPALTFTAANWSVPQTVTLAAVNDAIDEAAVHPGPVAFVITSADLFYNGFAEPDQAVNVTDDDTAAINITNGGSTAVTEGIPGDTLDVVLGSEPTAPVTITLGSGSQLTLGAPTLTFTPANWSVPQTVTVDAFDDLVAEGAHSAPISFVGASADPNYDTLTRADESVAITDNDTADVIVTNGGGLDVAEGGATDAYMVRLNSQPTSDVTVTLGATGSQVLSVPATLTFTAANWNVDQMVTLNAVDDAIAEGNHGDSVTFTVGSVDTFYNLFAVLPQPVAITDNDTASIAVVESGSTTDVAEAGPTSDTYTVVLTSEPVADVTVAIAADPQVTTAPTSLTFTAANWATPQTVTVTAVDDAIQEVDPHAGVITHTATSPDPNYDNFVTPGVSSLVTDNDIAQVVVTESGASTDVAEGGLTDTYDVVLATEPTADVTVTLSPDGQITTAPISLTFTNVNWGIPQTVAVSAVDDPSVEAPIHPGVIAHVVTSADTFYDALATASVTANVTDNDAPGITVVESGATTEVTEGGAGDSVDIVLESMPSADVVITFGGSQTQGVPGSITFTSANWSVPQTVAVQAYDDFIDEAEPHPGTFSYAVTSADLNYNAFTVVDTAVIVHDNDVAGVTVTPSAGASSVAEAGATSDTYDVVLESEPVADVTIAVSTADGQTVAAPASLTFTAANWNTPQTVTITAVDDLVDETDPHLATATHAATSADPNYDAITIDAVDVDVADNDTAGIILAHTLLSTDVTENGATDTVEVTLATQPTADVTVTLASGAQIGVTPTTLTFTSANWNVPQIATVAATDDPVVEGSHTETMSATGASADTFYQGVAATPLSATITDDDVAAVTITPATADITEGGATDTVDVVLDRAPLVDVTIAVAGDAQTDVAPATLTFTPANWNVAQTVTLTAIDDPIIEGAHTGTATFATTSADPAWTGLTVTPVAAAITDNDSANIVATETSGSTDVAENGATDTYDVTLSAQPSADVVITLVGTQVGATPATLTFTNANWNVAQTVTVDATDDFIAEGAHAGTIVHTAASADTDFDTITKTVNVNITDDETASIKIVETSGATDALEGGAGDSYTVELTSEPTADVTVTLANPDGQLLFTPATLTFTSANWNVVQVVSVDANDDNVAEGAHSGLLSHTAASADPNYAAAGPDLTVNIADNDTAGVLINPTSLSLSEGLPGATYDIVLTSEPVADVTVALTAADGQSAPVPSTLTFTAANWNVAQSVMVTAVNDDIQELPVHPGVVTHAATSTDPNYDGATIADLDLAITDDDVAGFVVTPSSGSTDVDEEGATSDTFDVVLTSEPTADVTVTMAADAQTTVSVPLTFNSGNWDTPQTVTVTAVDDNLIEATPHSSTITLAVGTLDPIYTLIAIPDETVNVDDNDVAGIALSQSTVTVDETGPTTATIGVTLTAQPTANVDIAVTTDAQVGATPATLTFTGGNWNVPQTVTIAAVDDPDIETPTHPGVITLDVVDTGSTDWDPVTASATADVTDNDVAEVLVDPASVTLDEASPAGAPVEIVLRAKPTADVVVDLGPDAQVTTSVPSLTFTSADWDQPQTVTVFAVDDSVAEADPHPGVVTLDVSSADTNFDPLTPAPITASIADNDLPGVVLTPTGTETTAIEGSMVGDSYEICLTSQPIADVDIALVDPNTQVTMTTTAHFTPTSWQCGINDEIITVTAIDDNFDETDPHYTTISHTVTSADPAYDGIVVGGMDVVISDNDTAGLDVQFNAGPIAEGATTTWTIKALSEPTAPITIDLADDAQTETDISQVVLDSGNWNTGVVVTITATQDRLHEASPHTGSVTFTKTTTDPIYDAFAMQDAVVQITDDDTVGVAITPTSVDIAEGGASGTYTVALTSQPTGDVDLALAAGTQVTVSPATLTFTAANFDTPQSVTVSAVDDGIAEGLHNGTVSHAVTSSDGDYQGFAAGDVTANITDNDTATILVEPSAGTTAVTEGATQTDNIALRLGAEPVQPVTINIVTDEQVNASATSVTFTPTTWNTSQEVAIGAVDDKVAEATPHTGQVTYQVATQDQAYGTATAAASEVSISDNDQAGLTVTETDAKTEVSEAGATDTYTVVLKSQPLTDVSIATNGGGQATTTPETITFNSTNWSVPQTVTVAAVDDLVDEDDPHSTTMVHTGTSNDGNYGGELAQLPVNIIDNDIAEIEVALGDGLAVTEGKKTGEGATDTFTVKLKTKPKTGAVVVKALPDDDVASEVADLTFTAENYDKEQTVTIRAVDDQDVEGDHAGRVELTVDSEDPAFKGKTLAGADVKITDNDKDPVIGPEDEEKPKPAKPVTGDNPDTGKDTGKPTKSNTSTDSSATGSATTSTLKKPTGKDTSADATEIKKPKEGDAFAKSKKPSAKKVFDNAGKAIDKSMWKILAALAPLVLLLTIAMFMAKDPTRAAAGSKRVGAADDDPYEGKKRKAPKKAKRKLPKSKKRRKDDE